ncbi:lantibiotic dehydratase C-terminal domain-containing protein [Pedobacter sp. R20-19]
MVQTCLLKNCLALVDKWFFIRYSDPNHHLRV